MASITSRVFKTYQNNQKEKEPFNEDLIHFKEREDIVELIGNAVKGLEIIQGFKFLGIEMTNPHQVHHVGEIYMKKKKRTKLITPIENSRYMEIHIKYELSDPDETVQEETTIYYPELIDGQYFLLNGNRFFPVSQLADSEFYKAEGNKTAVLKTLLMPFRLIGEEANLADVDGNLGTDGKVHTRSLKTNIFKKKIPIMYYFLAKFGLKGALEFLKLDEAFTIRIDGEDLPERDTDKYYYFKMLKDTELQVDREWLDENFYVNTVMVQSFIAVFSRSRISSSSIYDDTFWFSRLGAQFGSNKLVHEAKAEAVILSMERLLDDTTRNMLRLPEEDKNDIYGVIRFMMYNFLYIVRQDNHNLMNKRLRIQEYLVDNFTKNLSNTVVRLVNSQNLMVDDLRTIFSNIKPNSIINHIPNINLIQYNNNSSTLDLYTSILKASKNGPQAQRAKGGVSITSKSINPSYVGQIDLLSTSANDPGTSISITPFAEIKDPTNSGKFFFSDKPEILSMDRGILENEISDDEDVSSDMEDAQE